MKILYYLAYGFDILFYPIRFLIDPTPFKEQWGLRDIIKVQLECQKIALEQRKFYTEKINKEMEANRLKLLALEQDKDNGQDI